MVEQLERHLNSEFNHCIRIFGNMQKQEENQILYTLYGQPIPHPKYLDAEKILDKFDRPGRGRGRKIKAIFSQDTNARGLQPDRVDAWKPGGTPTKSAGSPPDCRLQEKRTSPMTSNNRSTSITPSKTKPKKCSKNSESGMRQPHEVDPGEDYTEDESDD